MEARNLKSSGKRGSKSACRAFLLRFCRHLDLPDVVLTVSMRTFLPMTLTSEMQQYGMFTGKRFSIVVTVGHNTKVWKQSSTIQNAL